MLFEGAINRMFGRKPKHHKTVAERAFWAEKVALEAYPNRKKRPFTNEEIEACWKAANVRATNPTNVQDDGRPLALAYVVRLRKN